MTTVLGIETSCDETAAAVVRDECTVLSNVVHSQVELHRLYRGVVPEVASRSHTSRILPVVEAALAEAGMPAEAGDGIDAIAVTHRPGMIGCLLVGMAAAKALSWLWDRPLVGVDHILAHVHSSFMTDPDLPLPCLALVASGGHTALYRAVEPAVVERLGSTRDDAAGEALDKGAALLGLAYPGGPSIQEVARRGDPASLALPRPMADAPTLDFSFSGIKTALLYHLRGPGVTEPMPELSAQRVSDLAASYQAAIVETLVAKMRRAVRHADVRSLAIGGGVARNELLRSAIREDAVLGDLHLVFPAPELCSDNGAMVAGLGTRLLGRSEVTGLDLEPVATSRAPRQQHRRQRQGRPS